MNVSEAEWMAYVDGETDPASRARLEAAMQSDPALAATVAAQQRLRARLREAYAPVLDEQVPTRLASAAAGHGRTWPAPTWLAMAASLALGVLLATWWQADPRAPVRLADGELVAAGGLGRALDRQLSADKDEDGIAIGLSFASAAGAHCRSFVLRDEALAGLACGSAGDWRVVALGEAAPAGQNLRQAASALPPSVLAEVDARLEGEVMDQAAERRARDHGWR